MATTTIDMTVRFMVMPLRGQVASANHRPSLHGLLRGAVRAQAYISSFRIRGGAEDISLAGISDWLGYYMGIAGSTLPSRLHETIA